MNTARRFAIGLLAASIALVGHSLSVPRATLVRIEKGTRLMLDLETPLNSATIREGDVVLFRTRSDIKVLDQIAIPQGTRIKGSAVRVKPAFVNGKSRHAELSIQFQEILLRDGGALVLSTEALKLEVEELSASSLRGNMTVNLGQTLPAVMLGAGIGGRQGAAVGGVTGLAVGAIANAKRPKARGIEVDLPTGAIIETHFNRPLEIPDPLLLSSARLPMPPPLIDGRPSPETSSARNNPPVDPNATTGPPQDIPSCVEAASSLADSTPVPASAGASPGKTSGAFNLSVDVQLVQVDAVVRDRAGKSMMGLEKEDFRVFEDGMEQRIQNFSQDALPLAVALVIDRSSSVAPMMNRIETAAFKALQHLKPGDQVALFSFAGDITLLEELTVDRQRVANRIGMIQAGGGTRILDAIDEAVSYLSLAAPDRRRAVILISDNIDGDSHASASQVVRSALELQSVVYSVRIRENPGVFPLGIPIPMPGSARPDSVVRIVTETGGEVFDTKASAFDSALETAVTRLKLRYTLGYAPTARSSRGRYHAIEVRLADRFGATGSNYTILSRGGYYE
jgi:Ca-activated chloride channel homolog